MTVRRRLISEPQRLGIVVIALLSCGCSAPSPDIRFRDAQRLVEQAVARHPELMRLTIHAVPTGETENRIIACNLPEKLGQLSDPEDLSVLATKQAVVLREGHDLDVTMPILDRAGNAIAAAGITLEDRGAGEEDALVVEAEEIARELTAGIQAATKLPW